MNQKMRDTKCNKYNKYCSRKTTYLFLFSLERIILGPWYRHNTDNSTQVIRKDPPRIPDFL